MALAPRVSRLVRRVAAADWKTQGIKFIWLTLCLTWESFHLNLEERKLSFLWDVPGFYPAFINLRTVSFPLLAAMGLRSFSLSLSLKDLLFLA